MLGGVCFAALGRRDRCQYARRLAALDRGLFQRSSSDQPDDDALRAADVAVPVDVPVLRHLAHEFGAVGAQAVEESSTTSTTNVRRGMPGVFIGALGAMLVATGVWNVDSSTRPWPSGVRKRRCPLVRRPARRAGPPIHLRLLPRLPVPGPIRRRTRWQPRDPRPQRRRDPSGRYRHATHTGSAGFVNTACERTQATLPNDPYLAAVPRHRPDAARGRRSSPPRRAQEVWRAEK